jgi:hypothetical protein
MKRLAIATALATVLLASSASTAAAEADVQVLGGSTEVTDMLAKGCDEWIRFSGTARFVYTLVSTATGTQVHVFRFVDANFTGVGETSGTAYRLVSVSGAMAMVTSDDSTVINTGEVMLKIFGGGQIYTVKGLLHTTIIPNGLIVSFSELHEDGCSS